MNQKNKQEKWVELQDRANKVVDGLGKGLDEGIVETVMGLWAHGFNTHASCEGHMEWGLAAPWVDIEPPNSKELQSMQKEASALRDDLFGRDGQSKKYAKYPELVEKMHELEAEASRQSGKLLPKLFTMLDNFYNQRMSGYDQRIIIVPFSGSFRLINQGFELYRHKDNRSEEKLTEYRQEMQAFGNFLKQEFLVEK